VALTLKSKPLFLDTDIFPFFSIVSEVDVSFLACECFLLLDDFFRLDCKKETIDWALGMTVFNAYSSTQRDGLGRNRTCPCLSGSYVLPGPFVASLQSVLEPWGSDPFTSHCFLCSQTDTSDPEKVVSAFLKVASVFKDEASVRAAVQDAVGNMD
jgi:hypothetical protein